MVESLGLSRSSSPSTTTVAAPGVPPSGRMLADAGIEIVSGMFGTVGEDYSTLETIRRTGGVVPDETLGGEPGASPARSSRLPRSLGSDLVSFHAGFLPEDPADPDYAKLIDRLRTLASMFADAGIDLAFETGQEEAAVLARFLDDLAAPNVGVNFDPANMILYAKGDPVAGPARHCCPTSSRFTSRTPSPPTSPEPGAARWWSGPGRSTGRRSLACSMRPTTRRRSSSSARRVRPGGRHSCRQATHRIHHQERNTT